MSARRRQIEPGQPVLVFGVGAFIEQAGPAGVVAGEVLVSRGDRDRFVDDRVERAVRRRRRARAARSSPDDSRARTSVGASARDAPSARSRARRHAPRARPDIAGASPEPKPPPMNGDMTRTLSDFMLEDVAEIALHVLHALGLVIDRELAFAVPHHGRGKQFHRIVMFAGDDNIRPRDGRPPQPTPSRHCRAASPVSRPWRRLSRSASKIGGEICRLVIDPHQRRGKARGFPFLGDNQRDRLAAENLISSS